jgi:hypothetical protein
MTKSEKMFALVDHWKAGSHTQKQFCQEHGIKVGTFAYWVAKRKQDHDPSGGFVALDVSDMASRDPVHITYPNGVVVSCPADLALIGRLIHLV